ncbi:MAG: hypothetical protein LCI00_29215 [Chloroflexi bacterium]|nr:hypothetical protein [Chloroflexota bacterium]MCC6894786.1 hypothetical protein [Anaerolineae bacterium]
MPYKMSWVIPSRVLLIELTHVLPADEIIRLTDECHTCVATGQAPVHIIIDATPVHDLKFNFRETAPLSKSMENEDIGWWILINSSKMMQFTASVITTLLKKKLKSAYSLDEALNILERVDPTLIRTSAISINDP